MGCGWRCCAGLVAVALALSVETATAALAPVYQRLIEFRAILDHPDVIEAFSTDHPIERIEYVSTDRYRVSSKRCHLDVDTVSMSRDSPAVGARQFDVRPGKRMCAQR